MTLNISVGMFTCAGIFKGGSDLTITMPPTEPEEEALGVHLHLVQTICVLSPVQPTALFVWFCSSLASSFCLCPFQSFLSVSELARASMI